MRHRLPLDTTNEEYDKALSEYKKAVRTEPTCAGTYNNLGTAYFHVGLHADAIAAYQFALRFKPSWSWIPRTNIGRSYSAMGELDKAVKVYDEVISLKPKEASTYRSRAGVLMRQGKGSLAAADASTFLSIRGWRKEDSIYGVLLAHFAYHKAGDSTKAKAILEEYVSKGGKSDWPFPVLRYLRQEISESEVMVLTIDLGRMTEARTYIGMDLALSGKDNDARRHFIWVKENGKKSYFEYDLAVSELTQMK